jgi:hypothetical protein
MKGDCEEDRQAGSRRNSQSCEKEEMGSEAEDRKRETNVSKRKRRKILLPLGYKSDGTRRMYNKKKK